MLSKSGMEWDASSLFAGLDRYERRAVEGAAANQLYQNGLDLENWAKQLAPLDEGPLTASIVTVRVTNREVQVGANMPYAAKTHYEMKPAPGGRINPGPRTQAKPITKYGEAGGAYISRPLLLRRGIYMRAIADAMRKVKK